MMSKKNDDNMQSVFAAEHGGPIRDLVGGNSISNEKVKFNPMGYSEYKGFKNVEPA